MKALAKSNRNLIMLLVGLVILLLAYFLVYLKLTESTETLQSELSDRKAYLEEVEACYENEAAYLAGIEESRAVVAELTAKLPADVKTEDFILYLLELESATGVDLSNISVDDMNTVSTFDCIMNGATETLTGKEIGASVVATMNYEQLKAVLDYIYASEGCTYLESASVAYNSGTAELGVVMDLTKLSLDYEGAYYNAPAMPDVALGLDDLFGTADEAELTGEVEEEEAAEETEEEYTEAEAE